MPIFIPASLGQSSVGGHRLKVQNDKDPSGLPMSACQHARQPQCPAAVPLAARVGRFRASSTLLGDWQHQPLLPSCNTSLRPAVTIGHVGEAGRSHPPDECHLGRAGWRRPLHRQHRQRSRFVPGRPPRPTAREDASHSLPRIYHKQAVIISQCWFFTASSDTQRIRNPCDLCSGVAGRVLW